MEQQDIEEIIKEWPEEWRNPAEDISDSDEDQKQEKTKEKKKLERKRRKNLQERSGKHHRKSLCHIKERRGRLTNCLPMPS